MTNRKKQVLIELYKKPVGFSILRGGGFYHLGPNDKVREPKLLEMTNNLLDRAIELM